MGGTLRDRCLVALRPFLLAVLLTVAWLAWAAGSANAASEDPNPLGAIEQATVSLLPGRRQHARTGTPGFSSPGRRCAVSGLRHGGGRGRRRGSGARRGNRSCDHCGEQGRPAAHGLARRHGGDRHGHGGRHGRHSERHSRLSGRFVGAGFAGRSGSHVPVPAASSHAANSHAASSHRACSHRSGTAGSVAGAAGAVAGRGPPRAFTRYYRAAVGL